MAKIFLLTSLLFSVLNDALVKVIGEKASVSQIVFFRFFIASFLSLICFKVEYASFKESDIFFQIKRGIIGGISFFIYTYSLTIQPLVNVVAMSWLTPTFSFFFATYILNEKTSNKLISISILVPLILFYLLFSEVSVDWRLIYPIISSFLFSIQDMMIKTTKVHSEQCMIFIFSITSSILSLPFAIANWLIISWHILGLLFLLGSSTALMQYFLIKAFLNSQITDLIPLRYLEIVLSALLGFIFFKEVPSKNILLCSVILLAINMIIYKNAPQKFLKD